MNAYPCRICPELHETAEARATCERQDIEDRVWLTA